MENALISTPETELPPFGKFFAPAKAGIIETLVAEYGQQLDALKDISKIITGHRNNGVIDYFIEGNAPESRLSSSHSAKKLFCLEPAITVLNSTYWQKILNATDIYDCMPQVRRDEWNKLIKDHKTPAFELSTVQATIEDLYLARSQFLAERVDGIFNNLSDEHLTNQPQGFSKRMIIGYMLSYTSINYSRAGFIHDLRCIIAKFMGRDDAQRCSTYQMLERLRKDWGQWHAIDGGAFRVRLYKKGTAHLEIHPDMAWRLNQILSYLHPLAIPAEFRTKKPRQKQDVTPIQQPLPFEVLGILEKLRFNQSKNSASFGYDTQDNNNALRMAREILESIGGVWTGNEYDFDYQSYDTIMQIVDSGCVPDKRSHQHYPPPNGLAEAVMAMAGIRAGDTVLEPSAGQGALAIPAREFGGKVTCVEISEIHCRILESRNFDVIHEDFLIWANRSLANGKRFDRIVMNPPFQNRQSDTHFFTAISLLAPGGRLVAVLPEGARGRFPDQIGGYTLQWQDTVGNLFADTCVRVCLCVVERDRYEQKQP